MSTGKENEKRKATVLKTVSGKQPLQDVTSVILNQPPEELQPSDVDAVLDPPAPSQSLMRSLCPEDTYKSPPSSPGYLDDGLGHSRRKTE